MSSDVSHSSSSDSDSQLSRSGLSSSVQFARQSVSKGYVPQTNSARPQEGSMKSWKDEQPRFLPEAEEELDYNEELPSLSNRDLAVHIKTSLASRIKSRSREPHSQSPREEGEEVSDEDDDDHVSSGHDMKRQKRYKDIVSRDVEEGEASSDEDQLRTVGDGVSGSRKVRQLFPSGFSLDEAEYRHRLHERHERRQRERQELKPPIKKEGSHTREISAEFVRPRSQIEPSGNDSLDRKKSSRLFAADVEFDERKKLKRAMSRDQDYQKSPVDDVGRKAVVDRKITDKADQANAVHRIMKLDSMLRSHSASVLSYDKSSSITSTAAMQSLSSHLRVESSTDRLSHRSKSKKAKHDRSEESSRRRSKKMKSVEAMDYSAWESYVYGSDPAAPDNSSRPHSGIIVTSPRTSPVSSHTSSSSSSPPHFTRPLGDPSGARLISSKHSATFTQHSDTDHHKHSHHRHKYNREARESAPPPEPERAKGVTELHLLKKVKSGKHRSKPIVSQDISVPKRGHHSKDRQSIDQLSSDEDTVPETTTVKSRLYERHRHSKSQEVASHDPLYSSDSSVEEPQPKKSKHRRRKPTSVSPTIDKREKHAGDSSETSPPIAENAVEDADTKVALDELPDKNRPVGKEPRPDRLQHYRLYSSSSSDDNPDDAANEEGQEDNESDRILPEHATLFDGTDPVSLYEALESRQPRVPSKPYYFPSIQGCRSVEEFECLNRIEEGTYGVVYRARDKKTNEIVALKRLKMEKERDGFPITSLREINTLMKAQHENIVTVREVVVGSNMDKIYLVMDYVEHDLKSLMEVMNGPFSVGEVKCLLNQLLKAVKHLHDNWILHRDLKTSNLLLSHQGVLKVGDFGLAREYGSPLKHYTEVVVTLWYRAPELLLGTKQYTCPIDLWSVGCIFAEFLLQRPLFPGKGEMDELNIIFRDLGTPNERIWPGVTHLPGMKKCSFTEYPYNQLRRRFTEKQISDQGFDLLNSFLTYCPDKRITAEKAMNHAYFNERPRAIHPSMFPSWPARSEGGVAVRKNASPRPPVGGGALAAAAAAIAAASSSGGNGRVRYQPPAPPMGGQRFYSSMGPDSRPGTVIGSGDLVTDNVEKGFLLRF